MSSPLSPPGSRWSLRLAALLLALCASAAWADAYTEVNRLTQSGQLEQARSRAEQFLAEHPRDPQMRFLKGVIQTESNQKDEALATFTALTQDYPELPEPYNNLAALHAAAGNIGAAREALETAIRLNPDYATAHENLGDVYLRMAAQAYGRAQQLDPTNTRAAQKLELTRSALPPAASAPR